MFLIVDSGSSKADWVLTDPLGNSQVEFRTSGINPFFLSEKEIIKILYQTSVLEPYVTEVKEIYFFGAGCSSPDKREIISNALSKVFKNAFINVENDVAAAVYATCGNTEGLSCILGTGSNISFYDGSEIHISKFGVGYILGDEGSGTYFGKKLLTAYLYGMLPLNLEKAFKKKYHPEKASVIKQIYGNPSPNFYLASFAKFMSDFKHDPYIINLLNVGFNEFIQTNIKAYTDYKYITCHFIGSIAFHFQDILRLACLENELVCGKILMHPIEELTKFIIRRETKNL